MFTTAVKMDDPYFKEGEYEQLRKKYPNRVPIFVTKYTSARDLPDLVKKKFLVPTSMTVREILFVIRSQLKLTPDKALFIFVGGVLPPVSLTISELYAAYRSSDGALRIQYSTESTFGSAE
jgi:hypothetical protein